jgi:hypothetical protein
MRQYFAFVRLYQQDPLFSLTNAIKFRVLAEVNTGEIE